MNTTIKNNAALRRPRGSGLQKRQDHHYRALFDQAGDEVYVLPPARPPASEATRRRLREKFQAEEQLTRHRRRVALVALIALLATLYFLTA